MDLADAIEYNGNHYCSAECVVIDQTDRKVVKKEMVDVIKKFDAPVTEGDIAESVNVARQTVANRRQEIIQTNGVRHKVIDRANVYWWDPEKQ